jgi:hypothetical protein
VYCHSISGFILVKENGNKTPYDVIKAKNDVTKQASDRMMNRIS